MAVSPVVSVAFRRAFLAFEGGLGYFGTPASREARGEAQPEIVVPRCAL